MRRIDSEIRLGPNGGVPVAAHVGVGEHKGRDQVFHDLELAVGKERERGRRAAS
jgi:hypothetical protein